MRASVRHFDSERLSRHGGREKEVCRFCFAAHRKTMNATAHMHARLPHCVSKEMCVGVCKNAQNIKRKAFFRIPPYNKTKCFSAKGAFTPGPLCFVLKTDDQFAYFP